MIKNADKPAAPVLHTIDGNWNKEPIDEYKGLTKREHFAAMAMQGIASNHRLVDDAGAAKWVASQSLAYADALLEALEKGNDR
jgi:hypothetical protein